MFPIDDGSHPQFNVRCEADVAKLRADQEWLSGYREAVTLCARAWGWDAERATRVEPREDGMGWTQWDVRLAKMIRSLWLFEEAALLRSMQAFARALQRKEKGGRSFCYGRVCLDEILHMALPRRAAGGALAHAPPHASHKRARVHAGAAAAAPPVAEAPSDGEGVNSAGPPGLPAPVELASMAIESTPSREGSEAPPTPAAVAAPPPLAWTTSAEAPPTKRAHREPWASASGAPLSDDAEGARLDGAGVAGQEAAPSASEREDAVVPDASPTGSAEAAPPLAPAAAAARADHSLAPRAAAPEHDVRTRRFVLAHGDGSESELCYKLGKRRVGKASVTVMELWHSGTPRAHRRQGHAATLAKAAFAHARTEGWLVHPTCSYVSDHFVPRHPEVADLVAHAFATAPVPANHRQC